jgi:NAD(P)H-dependent FMN reductase
MSVATVVTLLRPRSFADLLTEVLRNGARDRGALFAEIVRLQGVPINCADHHRAC